MYEYDVKFVEGHISIGAVVPLPRKGKRLGDRARIDATRNSVIVTVQAYNSEQAIQAARMHISNLHFHAVGEFLGKSWPGPYCNTGVTSQGELQDG